MAEVWIVHVVLLEPQILLPYIQDTCKIVVSLDWAPSLVFLWAWKCQHYLGEPRIWIESSCCWCDVPAPVAVVMLKVFHRINYVFSPLSCSILVLWSQQPGRDSSAPCLTLIQQPHFSCSCHFADVEGLLFAQWAWAVCSEMMLWSQQKSSSYQHFPSLCWRSSADTRWCCEPCNGTHAKLNWKLEDNRRIFRESAAQW